MSGSRGMGRYKDSYSLNWRHPGGKGFTREFSSSYARDKYAKDVFGIGK